MSRIHVEKKDYNRILLTDTLPYELPIYFTNEGLYRVLNHKGPTLPPVVLMLLNRGGITKPFNYKIKKSKGKSRLLSIIHPSAQIEITELYKNYESLILFLTNKSNFSLRHPANIASSYYEKALVKKDEPHEKNQHAEQEGDGFTLQSKYASSYFNYRKYNFLYKFYDSYEFHRFEKKYNTLLKFDLSKCFHNIYTDSLSWAVKSKDFSVENRELSSFEKVFSDLMCRMNFNHKNGIVVGPEFSRIFAEIILQRIDIDVEKKLEELGFKNNVDFSIKRYVDDYFIFINSESIANDIKSKFIHELEYYGLYMNDAKTEIYDVPFISDLSVAKNEIKNTIYSSFQDIFTKDYTEIKKIDDDEEDDDSESFLNIRHLQKPSKVSNTIIKDVKCILKRNKIKFESVSGYILSLIKKRVRRIIGEYSESRPSQEDNDKLFGFLFMCFEVSFFIYSMDCRVRTTYLISQMVIMVSNFCTKMPYELLDLIYKKIFDESILVIKKTKYSDFKAVELVNLLISLRTLPEKYKINNQDLLSLFPSIEKSEDWDYIYIIAILFYLNQTNPEFTSLILNKIVKNKFIDIKNPLKSSELIILYFDITSCPSISLDFKKELTHIILKNSNLKSNDKSVMKNVHYIKDKTWFTYWNADKLILEKLLSNKELRTPYE
jgi:hypothetical protein